MRALGAIGKGIFIMDHYPILLHYGGIHWGKDLFRFQSMWLKVRSFLGYSAPVV
jgi:hypothetical protein